MVAFNSRGPVREQITYAGMALKVEEEFKYMGVIFHKSGGMDSVDGQRARAFMGAAQGVVRLAGPGYAGSGASGVAAAPDLCSVLQAVRVPGVEYRVPHAVQSSHDACEANAFEFSAFLRWGQTGHEQPGFAHRAGKPFQFYWWKATVKF